MTKEEVREMYLDWLFDAEAIKMSDVMMACYDYGYNWSEISKQELTEKERRRYLL